MGTRPEFHLSARPTGRTVVMSLQKTPGGTRGARGPGGSNALTRFISKMMGRGHRRTGDKFQGTGLRYLTTPAANSGQKREATDNRVPDTPGPRLSRGSP